MERKAIHVSHQKLKQKKLNMKCSKQTCPIFHDLQLEINCLKGYCSKRFAKYIITGAFTTVGPLLAPVV
jgi:hypothetical protein